MTTKTKQDFPTTEEVREAYERTGLKPGAVDMHREKPDGDWCGCGLHALYLDSIGVRGEISDEEARTTQDQYFNFATGAYGWEDNPNFPLSWAIGFDDGIQGRKRDFEFLARRLGYDTGLAIRKELLNV